MVRLGWSWLAWAGPGWVSAWLGLAGPGWGWLDLTRAGWGWLGVPGAGWVWLGLAGTGLGWLWLSEDLPHTIGPKMIPNNTNSIDSVDGWGAASPQGFGACLVVSGRLAVAGWGWLGLAVAGCGWLWLSLSAFP